jgi:nicotinamidase-related amidase
MPLARPLPALDPSSTAVVLIDLQRGIVGYPTEPRPAAEVVRNASRLTAAVRRRGGLVVLVHVVQARDASSLHPDVDAALPAREPPPDAMTIVPELGPEDGDIVVTKRQWGAFYGTDLDLHLRRRGQRTILLGGIATNIGVEATARDAWERSYQLVFVEDAMAALSAADHTQSITRVFPRLGRVASTDDVLAAL